MPQDADSPNVYDPVAGRLVVAVRGELRLQLPPLEVGLEDEGVGGAVVGEGLLLVVEQEGHTVGPHQWAAKRPEAVGVRQELTVAEGDDRRAGQAGDAFEVVGPRGMRHAAERVEPRAPAVVEAPGRNQVDVEADPPPELDGVPGLGVGPAHFAGVAGQEDAHGASGQKRMTKLLSVGGGGGGGTTNELLGAPDELGGGSHQLLLLDELPGHQELLGHQTLPLLGG